MTNGKRLHLSQKGKQLFSQKRMSSDLGEEEETQTQVNTGQSAFASKDQPHSFASKDQPHSLTQNAKKAPALGAGCLSPPT
jgi:hypothetical protein